ncbi:YccF domain-containing protein [Saccharomonospora sp.]|uniref:YccF domain-containing protein n=1 Tax=Saccharomonospora sp. TaxID=33913 RepID=UPI002629DBC9|nr:YccF domain-containing protein [Saccharomonospora sp.]
MRALLNVIWLALSGIWLALAYTLAGIVCCILIVTIPFGLASFRIAAYALWPFGRTVTDRRSAGIPSLFGNLVWLLLAGWWIALTHLVTGVLLCLTVIGIPLGIGNFKMIPVSLLPLGREIVPA